MDLGHRLLDDSRLLTGADPTTVVAHFVGQRTQPCGALLGALLVPDTALVTVGRAARAVDGVVDVAAVVSGGAGGLAAAGREVTGTRLVAAHATLRDLDDLAGNARRVVAAARELDDEVEVGVGLPYAPGWESAVAVIEAAGLLATVHGGPQLAAQLGVLVEADLPYRVLPGPAGTLDAVTLLAATAVLVEEADVEQAARLLAGDTAAAARVLDELPSQSGPRLRRRLCGVGVSDVVAAVADLDPWL